MRRSPAFTATAIAVLSLGIGANTAIFSAINATMLQTLVVERPSELIALNAMYPDGIEPFSYAGFRKISTDSNAFVATLAASTARTDAIAFDGPPESVSLKWVSGTYFTTLGVRIPWGRALQSTDDLQPPEHPVAVISEGFWARRFGRSRDVVGRTFRLRGAMFTVIGVAGREFQSETLGESVDVWMPIAAQPDAPAWIWSGHSTTWLHLLARRRAGVSIAEARARLELVYDELRAEVAADTRSATFRHDVLASRLQVSDGSGGGTRIRDNLAPPLVMLMGIVGLVLLAACANIAHLTLMRASARQRDMAVSLALGAARWQLQQRAVAEALWLAGLGGAGGFVLAMWVTSALSSQLAGVLPLVLDISPDVRVLTFAATVSCATAVMFGLLPSFVTTRLDVFSVLKSAGNGRTQLSRIPFGRMLVVSQVAVSIVLMVVAGLLVRSLIKLEQVPLGFDPTRLVLLRLSQPAAQPSTSRAAREELYRQFLARAVTTPGVDGASASFSGLLSADTWRNVITVGAAVDSRTRRSFVNAVTSSYFEVTGISMLRGRRFTNDDRWDAPNVAIVNAAFAIRWFRDDDPLGEIVGLCGDETCDAARTKMVEVVGVVENARYSSLRAAAPPVIYVPFNQTDRNLSEVQVRTKADVSAVSASLYRTLVDADARVSVTGMTAAVERVERSLAAERIVAAMTSAFGGLTLLLTGVGLSGLIAFSTTRRLQEIGIRMALGATAGSIQRLVLANIILLVGLGAALGLSVALGLAFLLSSTLYEVAPWDPVVLAFCVAALAGVVVVAGYVPVAQATRVDPLKVLHAE